MRADVTDQELGELAAEAWQTTATSYRVSPYGQGLCILAETRDSSFQIRIAIDHPDARAWLAIVLREVARARTRLRCLAPALSATQPIDSTHVGSMLKPYQRPQLEPVVPAPFPLAPSAAPPPPDADALRSAVDFASMVSSLPPPPTASSDDVATHAESRTQAPATPPHRDGEGSG